MKVRTTTPKQSQTSTSVLRRETLRPTFSPWTYQSQRKLAVKFPVDAIFFISLKKAAVRRKKLLQYFEAINLTDKYGNAPQWHIANDGNKVDHAVNNWLKKAHKRPNMSLSEIGCCASHREVWWKQVQNDYENVLILEDDARFDVEKTNQLVTNWNRLPEFDFLHLGWEYYAGYKEQTIEPVEIEGLPDLWKGDGMWLTHAYITSRWGAEYLLERTKVQINGLDAMTADIQGELDAYGFKPSIAYQEKATSGMMRSQISHTG
jgi:GR25 family glycosyltransferase involved in LPS biosynthesis